MPRMTEEARRDFTRQVVEIMDNHGADLLAAGYDPANRKAELTTKAEAANAREADQVTARVAHQTATAASQEATTDAYKLASDTIEIMVGLLGKDHALSRTLRKLRQE
jgi:hypothetical protein